MDNKPGFTINIKILEQLKNELKSKNPFFPDINIFVIIKETITCFFFTIG